MNRSPHSWRLPVPQARGVSEKISSASGWVIIGLSFFLIFLLLLVPLGALIVRAVPTWQSGSWQASTVTTALRLSFFTSTIATATAILIGTPLAYVLARYRFFGVNLLDILIDLPMVLPPAVAGVALLAAFGRNGVLGQYLSPLGITIPFTTVAVIIAQTFVSAPFYIRAAKAGFMDVDPRLEQISATLGEGSLGTFFRVTLPLARKVLIGGAIMAWARALGEFGATILFAGNFAGRTQTMPLAIYSAMQSDLNAALILAVIMLGTSFVMLALLRIVTR